MRRLILPVLGALLAASCLVPSMEIVDSFGDAGQGASGRVGAGGEGGGGRAGSSAGGKGGSAVAGGSGSQRGGESGSGVTAGTSGSGATTSHAGSGGGGNGGSTSDGGTENGGEGNDGGGAGGEVDGGSSGTGSGTSGAGGVSGSAGNAGSAGSPGGSGGTGATGPAGSSGSSGSGGSGGGNPVTCEYYNIDTAGYVRAPAVNGGCFNGYGFLQLDSGSNSIPPNFNNCGMGCALSAMGAIGPASAANMYAGFVAISINLNQAQVSQSATKLTVTPAGAGLRVRYLINKTVPEHRVQISSGATAWCTQMDSTGELTVTVPYQNFRTECWDPTGGTLYDGQPIDTLAVVLPGAENTQSFLLSIINVEEY